MRLLYGALIVSLLSCTTEPEALHYGQDACHTCKMTLVDKKFGAELVTRKGKVYKFDDVNCMLTVYSSGEGADAEHTSRLVIGISQPAKPIPAADAVYVESHDIKSPSAGQGAAFETGENMQSLRKELNGIYMVWGAMVTQCT